MAEVIHIPSILKANLGEIVAGALVEQERLPADFYFRSLALDPERRDVIITQDVLAALNLGEPSGAAASYLHDPLPDCVYVPDDVNGTKLLQSLDVDYHRLYDLKSVAKNSNIQSHLADQLWEQLVGILSPRQASLLQELRKPQERRLDAGMGRRWQVMHRLSRIVMRDDALVKIYSEPPKGFGPARRTLLRYLLADNHPEYI
jgi:hypothetical protein